MRIPILEHSIVDHGTWKEALVDPRFTITFSELPSLDEAGMEKLMRDAICRRDGLSQPEDGPISAPEVEG